MSSVKLYPAKLIRPDGDVVDPVKVETTNRDGEITVSVWAVTQPDGIVEIATFDPDTISRIDGRRYQTTDGTLIEPARGCGCGHPLKRFRPPGIAVMTR